MRNSFLVLVFLVICLCGVSQGKNPGPMQVPKESIAITSPAGLNADPNETVTVDFSATGVVQPKNSIIMGQVLDIQGNPVSIIQSVKSKKEDWVFPQFKKPNGAPLARNTNYLLKVWIKGSSHQIEFRTK